MSKKPIKAKKRPKVVVKKVNEAKFSIITEKQLEALAKTSAYLQHKARLADFHYKQQLAKEFKKAHEAYIG